MQDKINEILQVLLEGTGICVIDITVRGERKNKVVEIFVDSENFLDLDGIAALSRRFNELLEKEEIKNEILKFVISSPGADRPFKYIWQLKKYAGRQVEFESEGKKFRCLLESVNENDGTLMLSAVKGKKEQEKFVRKFEEIKNLIISLPF